MEMFNLEHIEQLGMQSNSFTGTIPTEIGNLSNAKFISLSHNLLKGIMPKELESLSKLEYLHLNDNFLTGTAPNMPRLQELGKISGKLDRYITDCGKPSFLLARPLSCASCTLCCNSDQMCQENRIWRFSIQEYAAFVAFGGPLLLGVFYFFVHFGMKSMNKGIRVLHERDTIRMIDRDSTYCLIFSNSFIGWFIYFIVYFLQGCFYYMFLLASSFGSASSDWQFTIQCSASSTSCEDNSTVTAFGWTMFFVVTLVTLSVDFINSALQILKSVTVLNLRMFVSGFFHLTMTVLAVFGSFYYNMALATTNTELIVNAVILLFINALDEQLMNAIKALAPNWVDMRIEEIQEILSHGDEEELRISVGTRMSIEGNKRALPSSSKTKASNTNLSVDSTSMENYEENFEPAIETIFVRDYSNNSEFF